MTITQEELKEVLDYNRNTGEFVWRGSRKVAGSLYTGYYRIQINKKRYYSHRLAWLYEYGYMPENRIDHIDRNGLNNRIDNLREVSNVCNLRNTGNYKNNNSGVKGVSICCETGRWRAQIKVYGVSKSIGRFDDFDEAVCHRLAAEQCLNWEGCDSRSPAYRYVMENILKKESINMETEILESPKFKIQKNDLGQFRILVKVMIEKRTCRGCSTYYDYEAASKPDGSELIFLSQAVAEAFIIEEQKRRNWKDVDESTDTTTLDSIEEELMEELSKLNRSLDELEDLV